MHHRTFSCGMELFGPDYGPCLPDSSPCLPDSDAAQWDYDAVGRHNPTASNHNTLLSHIMIFVHTRLLPRCITLYTRQSQSGRCPKEMAGPGMVQKQLCHTTERQRCVLCTNQLPLTAKYCFACLECGRKLSLQRPTITCAATATWFPPNVSLLTRCNARPSSAIFGELIPCLRLVSR